MVAADGENKVAFIGAREPSVESEATAEPTVTVKQIGVWQDFTLDLEDAFGWGESSQDSEADLGERWLVDTGREWRRNECGETGKIESELITEASNEQNEGFDNLERAEFDTHCQHDAPHFWRNGRT